MTTFVEGPCLVFPTGTRDETRCADFSPAGRTAAYLLVVFHILVFLVPVVVSFLHAVEDYDVTEHSRLV